jgi:hypothetical protein
VLEGNIGIADGNNRKKICQITKTENCTKAQNFDVVGTAFFIFKRLMHG